MTNNKNGNITLNDVENFLGYPLKKVGVNQYQGQCPYCRQEGGDTSEDNLHFNPNKGIYCGTTPDNEHGKRLAREIIKARYEGKETYKKVSDLVLAKKILKDILQIFLTIRQCLSL